MSATETSHHSNGLYADDDFDEYPDRIFSSPVKMYEYDDWASDSDEDDEQAEWDAGITDFALFDYDRREAHEKNEPVPVKWSGVMQNQASALQRSVQRYHADSCSKQNDSLRINSEDVPGLTPDQSPDLRNDLDVESYDGHARPMASMPMYFTEERSPRTERGDGDHAYQKPMKFLTPITRQRAQSSSPSIRRQQRPGLSHSRTMSGHIHSWRKPDRKMYTVGEEPQAESEEDESAIRRVDSGTGKGYGGSRSFRKV